MKNIVLSSAFLLSLASTGFAADAALEGTAQGSASYVVVSNGTPRNVEAARMSNVLAGDTVSAQSAPVTLRLSDGSAVVVEENSSVTLSKEAVTLNSGKAVFGFAPKSKLSARYQSLMVKSSAAAPAAVSLSAGPESLAIEPMASTFTVLDTRTDAAVLESIESGETVLQMANNSWAPVAPVVASETARRSSTAPVVAPASVETMSTVEGPRAVLTTAPAARTGSSFNRIAAGARPTISDFE